MTLLRLGALLLLAIPALAQSDNGYDPGRNCRFYMVRHLPVPVHCLAELVGNWSPHPYIDGEFAFRDHDEFLRWRDREDYRHWKQHDFAWQPGAATVVASSGVASPAPPPAGSAVLCPAQVRIAAQSGEGWSASPTEMAARLDPSNPPRTTGAILICTYALGAERGAVMLSRPAPDAACRPRADGFDCPVPVN